MNHRERAMAVLRYQPYDRLPIVHFGFWGELLPRWAREGHLTADEARGWGDGNPVDAAVCAKLGFDFNWYSCFHTHGGLRPGFESKVLEAFPNGDKHVLNGDGVVLLQRPGAGSIPAEIRHTLTDRASYEQDYKWRYQWAPERVTQSWVRANEKMLRWDQGGLEFLRRDQRDYPYGLHCGSLFGSIRNLIGVTGCSYLQLDDEPLFDELIETVGDLCYRNVKYALESGAKFDFAHFWEDICFKNGPLVRPSVFAAKVGPQYRRITELTRQYGLDICSLDCDGKIDALIPTWHANGVNTMFPIEVGTWNASLAPWRAQFGRGLRGIGGVDKKVFARDRATVDRRGAEIARLLRS